MTELPDASVLQTVWSFANNVELVNVPWEETTALFSATYRGHSESVALLLKASADPNVLGAEEDQFSTLHATASKGYLYIAKVLVHAGAAVVRKQQIHCTSSLSGKTALYITCLVKEQTQTYLM